MSLLNKVYLSYSNKVMLSIEFSIGSDFSSLSEFSELTLSVGGEDYSTLSTPSNLYLINEVLVLDIGTTTAINAGSYPIEITGYDASDRFMLNCAECSCIPNTIVKDC